MSCDLKLRGLWYLYIFYQNNNSKYSKKNVRGRESKRTWPCQYQHHHHCQSTTLPQWQWLLNMKVMGNEGQESRTVDGEARGREWEPGLGSGSRCGCISRPWFFTFYFFLFTYSHLNLPWDSNVISDQLDKNVLSHISLTHVQLTQLWSQVSSGLTLGGQPTCPPWHP